MPDYSYIERYHRELAELIEFGGADNEENIRPAFQNCLAAYCSDHAERLVLVWCIRSSSGIKGRPTPICHPASSKNPFPCPFGKPWNNTTNYEYRTVVPFPLEDALYPISVHLLIIPTQAGIQS